jgi:hypothetical protein
LIRLKRAFVYIFGPLIMIDSANWAILHPCLSTEGIVSIQHDGGNWNQMWISHWAQPHHNCWHCIQLVNDVSLKMVLLVEPWDWLMGKVLSSQLAKLLKFGSKFAVSELVGRLSDYDMHASPWPSQKMLTLVCLKRYVQSTLQTFVDLVVRENDWEHRGPSRTNVSPPRAPFEQRC